MPQDLPDFGLFFVATDGTRIYHTLKRGVPLPHCYQVTAPLWCADEDPTGEPVGMFYINKLTEYDPHPYARDDRVAHRRVIQATLDSPHRHQVFKGTRLLLTRDNIAVYYTLKDGRPLAFCYQLTPPAWCIDRIVDPPTLFDIRTLHLWKPGAEPYEVIKETLDSQHRWQIVKHG